MLTNFFVFFAAAAPPESQKLTDPVVATKLGVTVQQLHGLRDKFGATNDDLLNMSKAQLQPLLFEIDHPGFDKHAAEQEFRALKTMDEHGKIPPQGLLNAIEHRKHVGEDEDLFPATPDPSLIAPSSGGIGTAAAGIQSGGWTWLGPGNIGGRIRAILMHPTSTNIMWCGGVDGGVWKTTNSGTAWFPLNDFMANLAISCMVMDPTNANIIYAGTGEFTYNADGIRGAGIFKTADGGNTWTQLTATATSSYQYVSRISIDPNNSSNILASTRSGIFRSTDVGSTWSQRLAADIGVVQFHPTDSSKAIASKYGGAYYSTDGGVTWTAATGFPSSTGYNGGRIEVTYSRSNPTLVFASYDRNSGELYGSTDGGVTYSLRNTGTSYLSGQGWYDNALWADPTTTNGVIVGGLDLWRSTDGGSTFTKISQWFSAPSSAHADHHVIVHNPAYNGTSVKMVFFGNDGGVYRATDVSTVSLTSGWQELNNNLGITQFYGGAGNSNTTVIVGGTQDNGSLRYTTGGGTEGWTTMFGGDGGYSAADNTDPNYFYGEYVYLQIHRSSNGGTSSSYIYTGITDAGSSANFIAPYILDPNNANTMLGGGLSLWRSTNVKAATPSWTAIKASISQNISAIAVAPGNSNVVWVGHNNGNVYSTTNGAAASPVWIQRDLGTPNLPNRYCERITIAPGDTDRVYVTFGGFNSDNVWRTSDSGVTWSNITGNLPAAPMNSIVVSAADTNTLYVGSEVGVFGTSNGGGTWSTGNDGPANVSVDELFWLGNKLVAVTHGRGMFTITPALGGATLINFTTSYEDTTGGNANAYIDPGEAIRESVVLKNTSSELATNVACTISTGNSGVTVTQPTSSYPNIAGSAYTTNTIPYAYHLAKTVPCGTTLLFTNIVTANGVLFTNTFSHIVGQAVASGAVTNTFNSTDVPKAILDVATIYSTNIIATTGVIDDVDVTVRLDHTFDGDLVIALQHPDATEVSLAINRGGGGANYGTGTCGAGEVRTTFDDEAGTPISAGTPPDASSFTPDTSLTGFDGKAVNGTWRLRVSDSASADVGTLLCWGIRIISHSTTYSCSVFNNPPVVTNAFVTPSLPDTTQTLTANVFAMDADSDPITFTYQWQESATNLLGQTASTLNAAATLAGGSYRVIVTPNDSFVNGAPYTTASVPVALDSDGDSLNDDWEVQYFGNLSQSATGDPDGDGFTNLQEQAAGTNPANAESAFRILAVTLDSNDVLVTWLAGGGTTNTVEYGTVIGSYSNISDNIVLPIGPDVITNYPHLGGATNPPPAFYRIRLVP